MNDIRLTFVAKAGAPERYVVHQGVINGIDTSLFAEGATFIGSDETRAAGIYGMEWLSGQLHITLGQMAANSGIAWAARGGNPINAADYDPDARYVQATNPHAVALLESGQAEYWRDPATGAWTVRMIDTPEEPDE